MIDADKTLVEILNDLHKTVRTFDLWHDNQDPRKADHFRALYEAASDSIREAKEHTAELISRILLYDLYEQPK